MLNEELGDSWVKKNAQYELFILGSMQAVPKPNIGRH